VELTIGDVTTAGKRRAMSLRGSLDVATRDELATGAAQALAEPGAESLAMNMSGVTFMDSTGIGALVKVTTDARKHGVTVTLDDPSDRVRRILHVTGLLEVWDLDEPAGHGG
jgi:anti-sigma B factor antagonist